MYQRLIFTYCAAAFLILANGCKKTPPAQQGLLSACFAVANQPATVFHTVIFAGCSKNALVYHWYFGDGATDFFDSTASHIYSVPGNYTVTLVTMDGNNDSSVISHNLFVMPLMAIYAGTFDGYEACSVSGVDSTLITVSNVNDTLLNIYNLYNSGKNFNAYANGFTITVPPQTFNTGSGNMLLQGSMQLLGDTTTEIFSSLSLSLIATSFSSRDACQATLYK